MAEPRKQCPGARQLLKETAREGRDAERSLREARAARGIPPLRPRVLPSHAHPQPALEVSEDEGVRLLRL